MLGNVHAHKTSPFKSRSTREVEEIVTQSDFFLKKIKVKKELSTNILNYKGMKCKQLVNIAKVEMSNTTTYQ